MIKKLPWKKIGTGLLVVLLVIQFFRPTRNLSNDLTHHLHNKYPIPDSVQQLLKTACYDCHSNATVYPWYTNIQPVGWWLQHHVNEGKEKINYAEFTTYRPYRQFHKMEETVEMIKEGEMPLNSYTWVHTDAKLTEAQKAMLADWAESVMNAMRAEYPADSLVKPEKKQ
ncbi:MAG TPA: heme-binding domain-containing protein [Chitinophagales bacterium]|nr:heme-binding domain-containing protein [Chitinophagales bacterium]